MAGRHRGDDVTVAEECVGTPADGSSATADRRHRGGDDGDDDDRGGRGGISSYERDMLLFERVSTTRHFSDACVLVSDSDSQY